MPFMREKVVSEIRLLAAPNTNESLDISNFDRIFSAAHRRSNARLKIALFCGLRGVVGGISGLSLEIRIVRRKFKRIGGNPPKSSELFYSYGNFQIFS
jgi:hypothetical protein